MGAAWEEIVGHELCEQQVAVTHDFVGQTKASVQNVFKHEVRALGRLANRANLPSSAMLLRMQSVLVQPNKGWLTLYSASHALDSNLLGDKHHLLSRELLQHVL